MQSKARLYFPSFTIITTSPSLSLALPPESCKVFGAAQLPDALAAGSCAQRAG